MKYQVYVGRSGTSVRQGWDSVVWKALCVLAIAISGCIQDPGAAETDSVDQAGMEQARTSPGSPAWQPFTKDSVWNLQLPAQRQESPLPAAGLAVAPMAVNDGDYGVKVYFASASDPLANQWHPPQRRHYLGGTAGSWRSSA